MTMDWKQHSAKIAVAINRVYQQSSRADQRIVHQVAESVADVLGRNPAFDRDRFLYVATYTGRPSGYRPMSKGRTKEREVVR